MGTKYTTQTVSGYNSSPPADDGSTSESNKTKWATVKTKLSDPVKTTLEAVNSALVTALDQSARSVSASDSTVAGDHNRTIQIASTITASITISLGDAATMAAGYTVTVANQSNVACVVDRVTASNTINGTTSSISIAPLSSITFIVNSATTGYIVKDRGFTGLAIADGGTGASTAADAFAALKQAATESATGVVELANNTEALAGSDTTRAVTSAGLASDKSLASSGYMKFPGGLIIQWGASGTSTGGTAGTFPIAFPNNAWKMVATCNNGVAQIQATINSVSGFTLTVNSGTPNASYIAIGN